ncbi:hypothetical protein FCM35_KLT21241 [Carex littledalei]|uniref:Uncharacterized protein n=1 Tax=Carex littledalei TaxID=544730 RepID=A0A833R5V9_9POAL|nr:hypothetical protein FCM35_KLT21241 [Carex littledalei]
MKALEMLLVVKRSERNRRITADKDLGSLDLLDPTHQNSRLYSSPIAGSFLQLRAYSSPSSFFSSLSAPSPNHHNRRRVAREKDLFESKLGTGSGHVAGLVKGHYPKMRQRCPLKS